VAAHPGSDEAKAKMPDVDAAIRQVEKCNAKYDHPLYQVILANLYAAGALEKGAEQQEFHPPDPAAINNYLQPAQKYYYQATSYVTPSSARPFLDGAGQDISAASKIYDLTKQRKDAETYP
jgi:hypothetical protein